MYVGNPGKISISGTTQSVSAASKNCLVPKWISNDSKKTFDFPYGNLVRDHKIVLDPIFDE